MVLYIRQLFYAIMWSFTWHNRINDLYFYHCLKTALTISKKFEKTVDKSKTEWYNIQAVTRQWKGPWKLNNIGKNSKLEKESKRFFWEVWGAQPHRNKKESRVIQRNAKRLREWVNTDIKRYLIKIGFNEEFDPGSGRTLAARLTHASRTELFYEVFGWNGTT